MESRLEAIEAKVFRCPYTDDYRKGDCNHCRSDNKMPHKCCCLTECGEHEMCRTCIDQKTGGIYYGIHRKQ